MTKKRELLTWHEVAKWSLIVLFIWSIMFCFICNSKVACSSQINALSILATVLGLLAGGSIAGFFSFEYYYAEGKERCVIQAISWMFIVGIFILIFLSLYCLGRVGIFEIKDCFITISLFVGPYLVLNGIVLLDRWDYKRLGEGAKSNNTFPKSH